MPVIVPPAARQVEVDWTLDRTAALTVDPVGAGGHDFAVKLRVARFVQMSK